MRNKVFGILDLCLPSAVPAELILLFYTRLVQNPRLSLFPHLFAPLPLLLARRFPLWRSSPRSLTASPRLFQRECKTHTPAPLTRHPRDRTICVLHQEPRASLAPALAANSWKCSGANTTHAGQHGSVSEVGLDVLNAVKMETKKTIRVFFWWGRSCKFAGCHSEQHHRGTQRNSTSKWDRNIGQDLLPTRSSCPAAEI